MVSFEGVDLERLGRILKGVPSSTRRTQPGSEQHQPKHGPRVHRKTTRDTGRRTVRDETDEIFSPFHYFT